MDRIVKTKKFNAWHIRFVAAKNIWELYNSRSNKVGVLSFRTHDEADKAWAEKVAV